MIEGAARARNPAAWSSLGARTPRAPRWLPKCLLRGTEVSILLFDQHKLLAVGQSFHPSCRGHVGSYGSSAVIAGIAVPQPPCIRKARPMPTVRSKDYRHLCAKAPRTTPCGARFVEVGSGSRPAVRPPVAGPLRERGLHVDRLAAGLDHAPHRGAPDHGRCDFGMTIPLRS
jgi:hypothetical protein